MTDEQIIKALEHNASKCKFYKDGHDGGLFESTLDLINRQQVEIESLKQIIDEQDKEIIKLQTRIIFWREDLNYQPEKIKSEAIKEFAERLKRKIWHSGWCNLEMTITPEIITNLVKEMTEVQK